MAIPELSTSIVIIAYKYKVGYDTENADRHTRTKVEFV